MTSLRALALHIEQDRSAVFPILFVPSFEESRCEGAVEQIEEGGFDIGANVPRRVSRLFAERGNNLPLSQPTLSMLLHFRAAREVYFNSSLPGTQLHSGNQQFKEPVLSAAAGRAVGPREPSLWPSKEEIIAWL